MTAPAQDDLVRLLRCLASRNSSTVIDKAADRIEALEAALASESRAAGRAYAKQLKAEAALAAAQTELQNIANANPREWGETSDQFQQWAQNRARRPQGDDMTLTELIAVATPGPWMLRLTKGSDAPNTIEGDLATADDGECYGKWIATFPELVAAHAEQQKVDAALIVAAVNKMPALIAALKAADHMRNTGEADDCFAYDRARAAVGEL